ncbi:hypothetical protein G4228_001256 [Cervus hanglu yarkandensis]|nr:hypothetical protein G4228_001256 [Cervus hanglu yarkandensis]
MGVGRRRLASLWALALTLACAQHTALNAAHGGRVCSTWGDFHYKTFDGDVFRFPGLCNYVFSAHCGSAYEDFSLQLRRGPGPNSTAPSLVTMKLDGLVVRLAKGSVLVNGRPIQLPFSQSGVLIEQSNGNLRVVAKLGLVFMWNQDDSLLLELDAKYTNQTCGLCGDFNGVPVYNEFFSHNVKLTPTEFGNLQKMDGPTEQCQDPVPEDAGTCSNNSGICEEMLSSEPFLGCALLVNASSYLEACQHDLCHCSQANLTSCLCHTLAEYSRQCAHAGGLPLDWRGPQLCPQTCPLNMWYHECGSPCVDTCSNPEHSQLCEDHCMAGCFCPEGMVLDDIGHTGCIPVSGCSCMYNGATYAPGTGYSTDCTNCTCSGGQWTCREAPCPGTCSVLGGAHISTFDEKQYTVHGDCSYVLAKPCDSGAFTVLAELRRCGLTDSESCLKSLTLSLGGGHTVFMIKASGEVFMNQVYIQLPVSAANVTLFRPSTFFIIAQTQLGLQLDIQLVPIMQVFVRLEPQIRGQTCGLCGNFNQNQADDFRTISGVVEGSAAAFANTWKTQAACPNIKNSFEDPCSLSVENEKFAQHWCSRLTDPQGPFAQCHSTVDPSAYYSNCMFDTCNCEKSEDCMCAALSSYVRACAARGVLLSGWRDGVCTKAMATCPKSLTYRYNISTCPPTCRARSDEDVTCGGGFVPVDGCTCPDGTFLDNTGACVPAASCPCYFQGSVVPNGESRHEQGIVCSCTQGALTCIGGHTPDQVCVPPMVYFDCRNATPGASGAGCQKSCQTLDMDCYSPKCEPGCVCPDGLVASGDGGCVPVSDCPCVHNEASYQPGQTIRIGCNTCTCRSRMWRCTDQPCLATCAVYGDGHYLTFDGRDYSFSGDCEYTLLQDHCGGNGSAQDSFRVVTENVPCGTTGTTCSKAIKIFLGSYELKLSDKKLEVIETGPRPPYSIRQMGIYLVVDTEVGLVLLWDKGTSIFLRLSPEFKGRVCGLCGNFDDNALNDFTTRSQSVVGDVLEFGNSWKFSPSCPDALAPGDPCTANPYRKSWAQKQCSIINSATFSACHAHVEPSKYYKACVSDACACNSGGDCECFCTAVAAYAQACHDAGVCVSWRTPDICPLFCDYYNPQGQCEWHYLSCGAPCLKTCRNPSGQCWHDTRGLEGCYPKCPPEAPIFDEDQMQCVASCPTPSPPPTCHAGGQSFWPGSKVPSDRNCYSCVCTEDGVQCAYAANACVCTYGGKQFHPGDEIYRTTDGLGSCILARCGANGTIERLVYPCSPTTPTPQTIFSFSTSLPGKADAWVPRRAAPPPPPGVRKEPGPSRARAPGTSSTASAPTTSATSVQTEITTSAPTSATSVQPSTTTSAPTTSATSLPTSLTTPLCYCNASSTLYPPGSIIYEVTDLSGHCYYAFCSLDCHVVKQMAPSCPTSMPPPTPTTSPPESSPSTSVSVPPQGCPNAVPPRTLSLLPQKGETWPMPNCSEATCQGNGVITVSPRHCPKVQKPTCANGYPAVQVADHDSCCSHYQCPCVCSGWGDPHYITFDGTYYTFLDNCTYVLVQQIVPVYGHFRVLVENYFCDAKDGLSCPQSIIVEYQENRVVLTHRAVRGVMTNEIIFNGEVVRPGFQKDGIAVSQVGIKMYVSIPELGVQVMFSGLIFSVEVPFSKFANNTEGQCGTCTNDQKDDCRLPGGAVVASCSDMSGHWKVTYPGQPPCNGHPPTPTPVEPRTSPTPCPPSPICQLILSKPFELCHALIPPWPYYQGCAFDQCHMPGVDVVCSALELYAARCASLGVCVDWRAQTNYTCPFTCLAGMEYRPCGPPTPSYCCMDSSTSAPPITEGCFCPQGTVFYSSSREVCVPADCNTCLGPGGEPVEPGHTVSVDCQECTCEGSTRTMSCRPQACPPAPTCPESGHVPVPEALQTGQCCPQYHCAGWSVCSINGTLYQGFKYQAQAGQCCGECVQVACIMNTSESSAHLFYPGESWSDPGDHCVTHECEKHWDGLEVVTTKKACPLLNCPAVSPGSPPALPGGPTVAGEDQSLYRSGWPRSAGGRAWMHPPGTHSPPMAPWSTQDKALPSEDGCCLSCPPPYENQLTCAMHYQLQVLRQQGCSSSGPVRLAYCQGNCGDTTSVFSPEANAVEHRCSCCRELRVSLRNVTLRCEDGSSRTLTYTEVEECGCKNLQCDSTGGLALSAAALEPSPESGLRRRGRRAPRARPLQ